MSDKQREMKPEDVAVELEALTTIIKLLAPFDKDQRERILRYVRDRFGVYMGDGS